MSNASVAQVLHIGRMFFRGALSRAQFEEFNNLAVAGQLTEEVAQQIIEGKFEFQNKLSDIHLAKIRTVWDRFGKRVFGGTFEQYLGGTDILEAVPPLPSWSSACLGLFDRDVFVDGRIVDRVGLAETCKLAGLLYTGVDSTLVAYEEARAKTGARWMRGQAGRKNRNRSPVDCRASFVEGEVGMDAPEGIFTFVDDPLAIKGHIMDLPNSVHRGNRDDCAYLGVIGGKPELDWRWDDDALPGYGSASRGV